MRKHFISTVIYFLLFAVYGSLTTYANHLFLYSFGGVPEITEITQTNTLKTLDPIIGKTYTVTNGLSINTLSNSTFVEYTFPQKCIIYQKENTQVYFNEYDIKYNTDFKNPGVLKVKDSIFSFSVYGDIFFMSNSTNQTIINTPMINVLVNTNACLFIKSEQKQTHVYVMTGNAIAMDSKSKKNRLVNTNEYLIVTPKPNISAHAGTSPIQNNMFSVRDVDMDDYNAFKELEGNFNEKLTNVLFVNYNTNIFGIKIKK